jgi:hypothetical protein
MAERGRRSRDSQRPRARPQKTDLILSNGAPIRRIPWLLILRVYRPARGCPRSSSAARQPACASRAGLPTAQKKPPEAKWPRRGSVDFSSARDWPHVFRRNALAPAILLFPAGAAPRNVRHAPHRDRVGLILSQPSSVISKAPIRHLADFHGKKFGSQCHSQCSRLSFP